MDERADNTSTNADGRSDRFQEITGARLPSDYAFIRMLGEGSVAHVFLVRNTALKRLVALKVLRQDLSSDLTSRKRFIREAQSAARISHPSVASVYTVGSLQNDVPFIEMQFIEGNTLAELLHSQGKIEVENARVLLSQIAAGLAAAHECRIIHRQVKPANVLVEAGSGNAYLTDFGIASILESGSEVVTKLTRDGEQIGDPAYMSPEQLRGEEVTPQSDVYCLGILAYEMLTLHGPFGGAEIRDVAAAHIRRAPIKLQDVYTDIPPDLGDALYQCVAKTPGHRPRASVLVKMIGGSDDIAVEGGLPLPGALARFLSELKKRKVYRSAVAYGAATFVLLQVADLVVSPLGAPGWVYRAIVLVSLAGFPITLALAWVFDLRQGRLMKTDSEDPEYAHRVPRKLRILLQASGLILTVVAASVIAWFMLAK